METDHASAIRPSTRSSRLIIVCGLPGSGKTTIATQLASERSGVRFAPDDWLTGLALSLRDSAARQRVEALQWRVAKDVLEAGGTAIIEWGTWARSERDSLRTEARVHGWSVELWFLDVPLDELWRRVQNRDQKDPLIQRTDLQRWWETFEPPDADELSLYDAHP